jgi:hypothetical protein
MRTCALPALLALGTLAAAPALAIPVVYTAGGTLGAQGGGTDPIQVAFSTVRITLVADTADTPTGTTSTATSIEARYAPASGTLAFTNRPGGAPDLTISYTPDLVTTNVFAPSSTPDAFAIDDGSTLNVPGSPEFFVAGFQVDFIVATFFPGTGPGSLPDFDVTGGVVVFAIFYDLGRSALYPLNNPFFSADAAVPEPGTALLLGVGVAGLLARAVRRARPAAR